MIGISSCLAGVCCRYNGSASEVKELIQLVEKGKAILICPEVLGDLSTPRSPAEIIHGDGQDVLRGTGKVVTQEGEDLTAAFIAGAEKAYQILSDQNVEMVFLKANSPSCGSRQIYDGAFSGVKKDGLGVAAAYFKARGIAVYSEEDKAIVQQVVSGVYND